MNTIDLLLSHRSIRKFTERPVSDDLLERILRAGQSAASSSFVQAYSLIRISDSQKRSTLVELAGSQKYIGTCAEFFVCCADLARNHSLCSDGSKGSEPNHAEQLIVATVDVALMAQNMVVAAESEGLGICYIGGVRNNIQAVSDLLELPEFVYPVFGLCLGYPAQDPEPKPRLPKSVWLMENAYREADENDIREYDEVIKNYYAARSSNKKQSTWTEELKGHFSTKVRPHMLSFLQSKGFLKR